MTVLQYQNTIKELLGHKLNIEATCEWRTQMNASIYAPRLDVAIGPFAIADGTNLGQQYSQIFDNTYPFIYKLVKIHLINTSEISPEANDDEIETTINDKMHLLKHFNHNARCFMAIEIENKVSRKHLMGGAINASVLGRIAIAVGYSDEMHRSFLKLNRYFSYLESVQKPTFHIENLLIISANQLLNVLHEL